LNVDVSWPDDKNPYTATLTAKPSGDFSDGDWTSNRWLEILSVESNGTHIDSEVVSSSSVSL